MKSVLFVIFTVIGVVLLAYFAGPRVKGPSLTFSIPALPHSPDELEAYILRREGAVPYLKPDNEARIIWADSSRKPTPWSIVYIHGFSASQAEGEPGHRMLAQRYGCNLYLARLHAHGQAAPEPLLDFHADSVMASAAEAVAVGNRIGEKTLVICTSTGGTLSLWLATRELPRIDALALYAPNIRIFDPAAKALAGPWGLQIARKVKGSNYNEWEATDAERAYWNSRYRLEATVQLQALVAATMKPETFRKVTQPVFLGYYFKNEAEQDQTVSVPAMLEMFDALATPPTLKRKHAFPEAGAHPIGSIHTSKDWEGVYRETCAFLEQVLGWQPKESR